MQKNNHELKVKLEKIKRVFDIDKALSVKTDIDSVAKYYRINKLAYSFLHNKDNFVHMGISRHGKYQERDLLEHAEILEKYISKIKRGIVLELGAGRGANSIYLARKHPQVNFHAVDLPHGQFDIAIKKGAKINNFYPKEGDYHNLEKYPANYFDIVFVIEALCYSNDKGRVFREVKRVLKKGGIFVIFDGYSGQPSSSLNKEQSMASQLTEKGMYVETFEYYPEVKKKLLETGFKDIYEEDASLLILPTLESFEKKANILFSMPKLLARMLVAIFPREFTNNALSGYLTPTLIRSEVAKYMVLITKKL